MMVRVPNRRKERVPLKLASLQRLVLAAHGFVLLLLLIITIMIIILLLLLLLLPIILIILIIMKTDSTLVLAAHGVVHVRAHA